MNKKMQAYWARHDQWLKERNEVMLSFDINKFKQFYNKWLAEGIYTRPLTDPDEVIEIAMRQAVLALPDAPADKITEAKMWLIAHGCSADPWR